MKIKKEIIGHKAVYFLLLIILLGGLFVRVYRVDQILGFYFDQGRDAKVIWELWHKGKFFLVGPTTGIAGIFRGPFYYYLIAPFYILGGGNPIWPAIFLSFTTTMASLMLYYLGFVWSKSRITGLIAALISSFSFNLMLAGRWLSNPTPMLFLSTLLMYLMYLVIKGKTWAWAAIAFVLGLSLFHFGSSGEFFYFFAIFIFALWQRRHLPSIKIVLVGGGLFLLTALPQILFDLRHDGILRNNVFDFLIGEKSFKISFWEVFVARINFYYDVFSNKIFHWRRLREIWLLRAWGVLFLVFLPKLWKNVGIRILLILLLSPMIGLLFFQGNFGNIYDYYLTGYYLPFVLLFSIVLGQVFRSFLGKIFVIAFLIIFLVWDGRIIRYKITAGVDGPETIAFGNQKQAVEYIYRDAGGSDFNVDVYVPPVIPHAYDYLFTWYGPIAAEETTKPSRLVGEQIPLLYTLYEVDPPHPERLEAWLSRQAGIGEVIYESSFGGITVQRRKRL